MVSCSVVEEAAVLIVHNRADFNLMLKNTSCITFHKSQRTYHSAGKMLQHSIQQILQHLTDGNIVSVKAQVLVLLKGQTATVTSLFRSKDVKNELVVSDQTALIGSTIWEDVTETVTQGQAYKLQEESGLFQ